MFEFYKGKTVLITGHTGFKGAWLCEILLQLGANVIGYALDSPTMPSLYKMLNIGNDVVDIRGDVRDYRHLKETFDLYNPEIVIHLAAQPIVRESYQNPVLTYETNVMGTVNVLECIRNSNSVISFLNVTTDKVYDNQEWLWGYRENDRLNGYDPYSNSKACSELVTHSYKVSFLSAKDISISTARAGNVIGGGDFSKDRIIPDCVRSVLNGSEIMVRNPKSVRPYQHVLEPLFAYLLIAEKQYENRALAGSYNVGPDDVDCITTGELVELFCNNWGKDISWKTQEEQTAPHESGFLKLDCSKIKNTFGWKPIWHIEEAMKRICEWTYAYCMKDNIKVVVQNQIKDYMDNIDW